MDSLVLIPFSSTVPSDIYSVRPPPSAHHQANLRPSSQAASRRPCTHPPHARGRQESPNAQHADTHWRPRCPANEQHSCRRVVGVWLSHRQVVHVVVARSEAALASYDEHVVETASAAPGASCCPAPDARGRPLASVSAESMRDSSGIGRRRPTIRARAGRCLWA